MQNIISNFESLSEEDISKYAGEWIAVVNNKVIVNGKSFKEIREFVKKNFPKERALIGKMPENVPVVFSIN